ncbi:hypothetical protein [Myxococcus stipitatus]|nr:hypothetical protein [Myxococcus stipitatus]
MPTKDEFIPAAGPPPGMPTLSTPVAEPLAASASQPMAKPASEYGDLGLTPPPELAPDVNAVREAQNTGGPVAASQKLLDLVNQHGGDRAYVDNLLSYSKLTLQEIGLTLGERVKSNIDDKKGKNITSDTLDRLAQVADKAGSNGLCFLGQALAQGLPNDNDLNQFDDSLKDLREDKGKTAGVDKLAGATVKELMNSDKNKAWAELRTEYRPINYATQAPETRPPDTSVPPGKMDPNNRWTAGSPLSAASNAHLTNTEEQFQAAASEMTQSEAFGEQPKYNFFEGDLQAKPGTPPEKWNLQMAHDDKEEGTHLSLDQWLEKGKALGVGLKLDVKIDDVQGKADAYLEMLDQVQAKNIPDGKLMFNLGPDEVEAFGGEIRKRFPNAILALNPGEGALKPDSKATLDMIRQAEKFGSPVSFVLPYDRLPGDRAKLFSKLEEVGPVSVWSSNDPRKEVVENPEGSAKALREAGATGVIDLKKAPYLAVVADKAMDIIPGSKAYVDAVMRHF